MDNEKPLRGGIRIAAGAKGNTIHRARIRGMDIGIEDAGEGTTIHSADIAASDAPAPNEVNSREDRPDQSPLDERWNKTPLGDIALKAVGGALTVALIAAIAHWWPVLFP